MSMSRDEMNHPNGGLGRKITRAALALCVMALALALPASTWAKHHKHGAASQPTAHCKHKSKQKCDHGTNATIHYHYHYYGKKPHHSAHHKHKGHHGAKAVIHYHFHYNQRPKPATCHECPSHKRPKAPKRGLLKYHKPHKHHKAGVHKHHKSHDHGHHDHHKHHKNHDHHKHHKAHHHGHHDHHKHHGHRPHGLHKHAMHHHGMRHDFSDVKRWVKVFENPKRKAYQKPAEVASVMAIQPGMTVADIGAGTGYFLPYLRASLGDKGKLLALDISKPLVKHMSERIKKAGWKNAEARHVSPTDPKLKAGSVDRILIANTWHHIQDRIAYGKKLFASLKPGGALYILDFTMDSPFGPGKKHRLTEAQVTKELQGAGFQVKVAKESLPHHYIVYGVKVASK